MLVLTRTAHPGLAIAARESGLKVIMLQQGCSKHAAEHGMQLMKHIFAIRALPAAKAFVGKAEKGLKRASDAPDLQFLVLSAPAEQPIRLRDVEPRTASAWRGGLNRLPTDLDTKVTQLVHAELAAAPVELQQVNGQTTVVAQKPLRDGDRAGAWEGGPLQGSCALAMFWPCSCQTLAQPSPLIVKPEYRKRPSQQRALTHHVGRDQSGGRTLCSTPAV